jgi:uncharacterized protein DUF5313
VSNAARTTPNLFEYIGYSYGRRLPDSMRQWVADDLAGKGATVRMMVRVFIPAVLLLAPFWLIPTTLYVHVGMTVPILIPFVYFSHALNKIWRRHMLRKHNLNPDLVDYISREKNAHVHRSYIERYGPRPDSVRPSSHDI